MKKFVYQVEGFEFVDSEAFGTAWKAAKIKAAELHTAIHRLVIKGDEVRQESFCSAGIFARSDLTEPKDWKVF